jgi:hypothetical protein
MSIKVANVTVKSRPCRDEAEGEPEQGVFLAQP